MNMVLHTFDVPTSWWEFACVGWEVVVVATRLAIQKPAHVDCFPVSELSVNDVPALHFVVRSSNTTKVSWVGSHLPRCVSLEYRTLLHSPRVFGRCLQFQAFVLNFVRVLPGFRLTDCHHIPKICPARRSHRLRTAVSGTTPLMFASLTNLPTFVMPTAAIAAASCTAATSAESDMMRFSEVFW